MSRAALSPGSLVCIGIESVRLAFYLSVHDGAHATGFQWADSNPWWLSVATRYRWFNEVLACSRLACIGASTFS